MTIHVNDNTITTAIAIDTLIADIADARSRQNIVAAWQEGEIDGDKAMALLIALDLIEVPLP